MSGHFDKYEGFGKLKGMQVTGEAELVAPFSDEYNAAAEFRKIPLDALKKNAAYHEPDQGAAEED